MKVYRYEIESNLEYNPGPYNAHHVLPLTIDSWETTTQYAKLQTKLRTTHNKSNNHPNIIKDVENFRFIDDFCACPSIELLKQWFKGFNKQILNSGFNIVEYTVKDFNIGKSNLQGTFKQKNVINKKIIK